MVIHFRGIGFRAVIPNINATKEVKGEGMVRKCVLALLVVLALVAAPAMAQQLTGSVSGIVKDNSGVALPGVTVTITAPVL